MPDPANPNADPDLGSRDFADPTAPLVEAVRRLRDGGLVAFPTETVYGLGADARSAGAVRRVFAIKGRPPENPLIVHVDGAAMARTVVREWPAIAQTLAERFWPGPLTLVLPRAESIPSVVTSGSQLVAVRCPNHPLTLALLRAFAGPLVGPSANRSGLVSPTRAEHVRAAFSSDDVLVLDGGPCAGGIESTVLLLTDHPPRILRPGLVSAEEVSAAIKGPVSDYVEQPHASHASGAALPSPGLLAKHYAPSVRALLVEASAVPATLAALGGRAVVITHTPVDAPSPHETEFLPADAKGYAAGLYAALRSADERKPDTIVIVRPVPAEPYRALWLAILDRLRRATG